MAIANSIYTTNLLIHTGTDFVQIFTLADDGGAFNLEWVFCNIKI